MAKVLIITPAAAAFIASCMEIGFEGSEDGAEPSIPTADVQAAEEMISEFRSWADSDLDLQITFEENEDNADEITVEESSLLEDGMTYDEDGLIQVS